jgi:hypothetical protein
MTVKDQENRAIIISAFTGLLFCIPIPDTAKTAKGKGKDVAGTVEFEPFEHK